MTDVPEHPLTEETINRMNSTPFSKRINDIEHRWGKAFEDVIADIHDHIFGATTKEHLDAADARDRAAREAFDQASPPPETQPPENPDAGNPS